MTNSLAGSASPGLDGLSNASGCGATAAADCGCGTSTAPGPLAEASVTRARPSDAPAIGAVQEAVWRGTFASVIGDDALATCTAAAFASAWRRSLTDPPARHAALVARAGAQVTGWIALTPSDDPDADDSVAEVTVLGVHPAARGQGHGSRLLNAAVDTARNLGFITLTGWVPQVPGGLADFVAAAGPAPDGARRQRIVSPGSRPVAETRCVAETRYAVSLSAGRPA